MKLHFSLFLFMIFSPGIFLAQEGQNFWTDTQEPEVPENYSRWIIPESYRTLSLNLQNISEFLASAPNENKGSQNPSILSLPYPDGTIKDFYIVESPVMAPELAAKFPEIKTFSGWSPHHPGTTMRMDITPRGNPCNDPGTGWLGFY
jgi:hypothetical protein